MEVRNCWWYQGGACCRLIAGPKLGNAGPPLPPEIIFRGPLKMFSWMAIQKSEPRRGDAKLGGIGTCPPENFAELDLTLEAFCAF